jgi:hypothetical protein
MEPNGTRPISTLRPDSRSHSSEPTADTDGEQGQQQRHHMLAAAQGQFGEIGQLRQIDAAHEPEPGNAQHRLENGKVLVSESENAPGFGNRIPVDFQVWSGGRRFGESPGC